MGKHGWLGDATSRRAAKNGALDCNVLYSVLQKRVKRLWT